MSINDVVEQCVSAKLEGKQISWVKQAKKCKVHPEKLRGRVRRRLKRKKDYLDLSKLKGSNPKINTKKLPKPYTKGDPNNVLVIGDLHAPFMLDDYLEFCRKVQERFDCGTVVQIGDLVDGHAWSFHGHDPDGMSVGDELEASIKQLKKLWYMFPKGICTLGNHDDRIMRKAFDSGLSSRFIKEFGEIIEAPKGWKFVREYEHNGALYLHGTGSSGQNAAYLRARDTRMPIVMGHVHSESYARYMSSFKDTIWALQVGCGVDNDEYAFQYGKTLARKPILNCGVVLNNTPMVIPYE